MKIYTKKFQPIYAGISVKDDMVGFNFSFDNKDDDVVYLKQDVSGTFIEDGVNYVYAYEYSTNSTQSDRGRVRKYLKDIDDTKEDTMEFVENGILTLDKYHRLDDFDAIITTYSSKSPSLTELMYDYFAEYSTHNFIDFHLLKKTYRDVKFDGEKAYLELIRTGYSIKDAKHRIRKITRRFIKLKETDQLFEMKKFLPRVIRSSFYDFLKFPSEEEKHVYMSLQGVDVLIYDDFLTSGATVKEIVRYLRSFHNENSLTVFVLVKQ